MSDDMDQNTNGNEVTEHVPEDMTSATNIVSQANDNGNLLENSQLDLILDIPVMISVEIGKASMSIRNLLQLNQGSIVELDRLAGEPLDVFVNGTLIAHGEVVVINEKFGIRLTDVISASDRIRQLRTE